MKKWRESLAAHVGWRAGGAALLGLGGLTAVRLHQIAAGVPAREPSWFMMLLAAAAFLCGSAGSALLFAGPGLRETVEVSERWRRLPPDLAAATEPDRGF